jgi:small subunit ribosomal protein S2
LKNHSIRFKNILFLEISCQAITHRLRKTLKMGRKKKEISEEKEDEIVDQVGELSGKELEKAAEAESTISEKELEEKKKEVLEKAKKLAKKISAEEVSTEELKEKVKIKKRTDMLVPLEDYVKTGIYLGTRVVTPMMKPFVYRRRADGLAIFNTDIIDEKLKEGIEYLSKFAPEEIVLVCKREAGWKAAEMFSKLTGIRVFTKKYPAGILTNTTLPDFFENELTIITDSWLDKNALHDTKKVKKKVLMICDTNNFSQGADETIIGNNKSAKSLGLIFYLLTRGYCKAKEIEADIPDLEWWTTEEEGNMEKIEEKTRRVSARYGV